MLQMSSLMQEMGGGPPSGGLFGRAGGLGGAANPTSTQTPGTNTDGTTGQTQSATGATNTPGTTPASQPQGPFLDPLMMQQLMGAFGGPGGGALGGGLFGAPAAPADTRPPEERFQVQLEVSVQH